MKIKTIEISHEEYKHIIDLVLLASRAATSLPDEYPELRASLLKAVEAVTIDTKDVP